MRIAQDRLGMGQRTRVTSSQLKGRNADLDDLGAFREHKRGGSNSKYSAGRMWNLDCSHRTLAACCGVRWTKMAGDAASER